MPDIFADINAFHTKFGFEAPAEPTLLDRELWTFRSKFTDEEVRETNEAYEAGDLPKVVDGLMDQIYVAAGTLWMMGCGRYISQAVWDGIHRANMQKRRADRPEQSARGSTFDVVKPEGWQAPDIGGIIEASMKVKEA